MVNKTLTAIVFSSAFGLNGCLNHHSEYDFNGKVGEDQVHFAADSFFYSHRMEVLKQNGDKIVFLDVDDLLLDRMVITVGDNSSAYSATSDNEAVKKIMADGQKQFDLYLQKILEIQNRPLRE